MKKALLMVPLIASLSGCLGFTTSGLGATATATTAAVAGTATGGPLAGIVAGAIAGSATDAYIHEKDPHNLTDIPAEQRAQVLREQALIAVLKDWGYYLLGGGFFFVFVFPFITAKIGQSFPNKRQRKLEQMAFDDPNVKSGDLK